MKQPYLVGISGGSGSGKSTLARQVVGQLPQHSVALLEQDAYYRSRTDLTEVARAALNFDHPSALETELLCSHLNQLIKGQDIVVPIYDYATHLRTDKIRKLRAAPIVVVEGMLLLSEPSIRKLLDLKIYVDTDADIRVLRRFERDMRDRGRSFDQIKTQYNETVRPMHLQFVEPSRRYADVIIPDGGYNQTALDLVLALLSKRISPAE